MGTLFSRDICVAVTLLSILAAESERAWADPPRAKASLGDLTFHHSVSHWRIEPAGAGLTATCLQADCRGVVFDFSVRDVHGECDKESVRQMAEHLFPAADRHPVNIYSPGRFGLVMAQSWRGPEYVSPRYVFGCLDWQDREYRFATRPETVGDSSWTGGALLYLLSRATSPPAQVATLKLHELGVPYSTDRWRPAETAPGDSYRLSCLAPTCRAEGKFVTLTAEPTDVGCSFHTAGLEDWTGSETRVTPVDTNDPNAPDFSIGTTHYPCRNYVPPKRVACAWHDGIAYRITSPGGTACRSGFGVPADAFEELVSGARFTPVP